jgi:hypothetical protein
MLAEILLIWALRPNLQKLFSGKERIVKAKLVRLDQVQARYLTSPITEKRKIKR